MFIRHLSRVSNLALPAFRSARINSIRASTLRHSFSSASSSSTTSAAATSDDTPPPPRTWVDDTPDSIRPYLQLMRIDKSIGTWLLFWPCGWSIALAAAPGQLPSMSMLAVFGAGALLMRGAGCTINDLWDRDIDGKVARTKLRPLASGALQPRHAIGFLAAQLTAGLGVLLQLNYNSILLGAASLPLVVIYPLMKRYTNWPQLVLGLAFNWGALLGWVAVRDAADLSVMLPLYAAGVSWTIVYDTIYALQDTRDDKKLGLKSTALHFGDNFRPILSGFSALTIGSLAVAGHNAGCGIVFTSLACVGGAAHLAWQITTVDATRVGDCAKKFIANKWFGALVFAAIVADRWMAVPEPERSPADAPKL